MEEFHESDYRSLPGNMLVARYFGEESPVELSLLGDTCRILGGKFTVFLDQHRLTEMPRLHWDKNREASQYVTAPVTYAGSGHQAEIRLRWSFGPKNLSESFCGFTRERCAVEISNSQYLEAEVSRTWHVLAELEGQGQVKNMLYDNLAEPEATQLQAELLPKFVIPPKRIAAEVERQGSLEEFQAFLDLVQCIAGPMEV